MIKKIEKHQLHLQTVGAIERNRDALRGEFFVKAKGREYLPCPSVLDDGTAQSRELYKRYLQGAEFMPTASDAQIELVGKLGASDAAVELPSNAEYLIEDADGDGLSLSGVIEQAAAEIMLTKWCLAVADYRYSEAATMAEGKKDRAVIKLYSRERVVNWNFGVVDGAKRLNFVMVEDVEVVFNPSTLEREEFASYLVFGLDDDGNYYQQKLIKKGDAVEVLAPNLVLVGGKPIKYLPIAILSDCELYGIPEQLGYLTPIIDKCFHSYQVSADYKEALRNLAPTTNLTGFTPSKFDQFVKMNGRGFVATGSGVTNIFPEGVEAAIMGGNAVFDGFQWYFENTAEYLRGLGCKIQTVEQSKTATQASIESAEKNAFLRALSGALESGFTWLLKQACVLAGVDGDVVVELPEEFGKVKMTYQEGREVAAMYAGGLYSKAEAIRILEQGGLLVSDVELVIAETEAEEAVRLAVLSADIKQ